MKYINVISETPNLKMNSSVLSKVDYKDLTMGIEFEFAFNVNSYVEEMSRIKMDDYENDRRELLNELIINQRIYNLFDFVSKYQLECKYDHPTYQEIIDFKTRNYRF